MASIEVLAGPERRRRWSIEQKQAIVAAAFERGAVVRDVARRVDVTSSLIYRWRRNLRVAANGFAQVFVAPAGDVIAAPPGTGSDTKSPPLPPDKSCITALAGWLREIRRWLTNSSCLNFQTMSLAVGIPADADAPAPSNHMRFDARSEKRQLKSSASI
jgi:Transposase